MRKKCVWLLLVFAVCFLTACSKQVITVAGAVSDEEAQTQYIEMQEFELKEQEIETGRVDMSYCALLIPEGYVESEEVPGMYVHPKAPLDSSNIYYTVSDESIDGQVSSALTQEIYEQTIETAFEDAGKSIDLQVKSFEQIDMEGIPGYKIRSTYAAGDEEIEQLAYIILAENTCTITYSQVSDDELMADFEVSDGQIKLIKEPEVSLAKR